MLFSTPPEINGLMPDPLIDDVERLHREREDLLALPSTSDEALEIIRRIVAVTPQGRASRITEIDAELEFIYAKRL